MPGRPYTKVGGSLAALALLLAVLVGLPASPVAAQPAMENGLITFNRDGVNYTAQPDGTDVRRISDPALETLGGWDGPAEFNADGTKIAFTRTLPSTYDENGYRTGGMREIYTADADGTNAVRITHDQSNDKQAPSWSPDGTKIAFVFGSNSQLSVMNADGSGRVALGPTHAGHPSFSADGATILYYAYTGTNNDVFTIPTAGGTPTPLTSNAGTLNMMPDYSPDGSRIVFVSNRVCDPYCYERVWVMNSDGSDQHVIHVAGKYDRMPRWSPDGARIVFDGWTPEGSRLFTMNPDGTGLTQIDVGAGLYEQDRLGSWQGVVAEAPAAHNGLVTFNRDGVNYTARPDGSDVRRISDPALESSGSRDGRAQFSADGTKIAFTRTAPYAYDENGYPTGGMREIYTADADGSNAVRITHDQSNDKQSPAWSPDGSQIVFVLGPNNQLTVMNADGSGQRGLGPTLANFPSFSHDGGTILYYASSGGSNDVFTIPVGGGTPTRLTSNAGTLNLMPDYSPDGSRIVFVSNRICDPYCYERVWVMNSDGSDQHVVHVAGKYDTTPKWSPDGTRIIFGGYTPEGRRLFTMNPDGTELTQIDVGAALYQQDDLGSWQRRTTPLPALETAPPPDESGPPPTTSTTTAPPVDDTPPSVTFVGPTDGASYQLGEQVLADYACDDPAGVATCSGTVAVGDAIDTATTGEHAFEVHGVDVLGNAGTTTVRYTVVAPPGAAATEVTDGGTVTTDPTGEGATAAVPLQTTIEAPPGTSGLITVTPQETTTEAPTGFSLFGTEVVLEGPVATVDAPYTVQFTVDSSVLGGVAPADVQVYRDGSPLSGCTDPTAAVPDPCIVSRGYAAGGSGDAVVTVRTSHFSTWSMGRLAYDLLGPLQPVAAAPDVNAANAGATVPVRFRLGGDRGLDVLSGTPSSTAFACEGTSTSPAAKANGKPVTAGPGSRLQYDAASDTYTYLWRTTRDLVGCRDLVLELRDGTRLRTLYALR